VEATRTIAGIFTALIFEHEPTLGDVVKAMGWGSNRDVRQRGFRIDTEFDHGTSPFFSRRVKEMDLSKNPHRFIESGQAVLVPKGDRVVVVMTKEN
jgi:hypothetical protein